MSVLKPLKFMQLARNREGVFAVEWKDCDYNFAIGHSFHHAVETKESICLFFTNDLTIQKYDIEHFLLALKDGKMSWVMINLETASNPLALRQPVMNSKRKK